MGIQGLLPLLKSIMVPFHIKDLEGCKVAVDTYSWLHKGALSCSTELCKGFPTSRHIEYCMHRVKLLQHYGITPILVFDGGFLPMKMEQENKRAKSRKDHLDHAIEHESVGNFAAAHECYQKAVDISPRIAHELIQVLKKERIPYIVAPYEADAQMTFLAVSKQVNAVITEDSDLIPFGCPRIIFKMDKYGEGVEFKHSKLPKNRELNLVGFSDDMLLEMCILSGCDYLQSLPGMGLRRAHALVYRFKSYDKVIKHLKFSTSSVPSLYEESFKKAILTFRHQRVYDPIHEDIVHLSCTSENIGTDLNFLGPLIPQHIASAIAQGDLDPFTQIPFQCGSTSLGLTLNGASGIKCFNPESRKKRLDLPVQKNLLSNYFCFVSLDAKRKFRAPRTMPIHPDFRDEEQEHHRMDIASSCNMNSSSSSLSSSVQGSEIASTLNEIVGFDFAAEVKFSGIPKTNVKDGLKYSFRQQFEHSAYNPCQASLKKCDSKQLNEFQGDTILKNKKPVVQSPFSHKSALMKNDLANVEENLLNKDRVAFDMHKAIPTSTFEKKTVTKKNIVGSSYFLEAPMQMNAEDNGTIISGTRTSEYNDLDSFISNFDCVKGITMKRRTFQSDIFQKEKVNAKYILLDGSHPENDNITAIEHNDTILESSCKTEIVNKRIARSPYFLLELQNRNVHENKKGEIVDEANCGTHNKINLDTMFCKYSHVRAMTMKRKVSINDISERENTRLKCITTDISLHNNGSCDVNETHMGTKSGEFETNILHLSHYSDIAGKSMDKFATMISSFRHAALGSRASGLRAPLKNIHNNPS